MTPCAQVGDRLDKTELAQSRLRWHVDKDNKGSVTVMDVDRAFPPHISLVERVGTFIDTQPDTCARGSGGGAAHARGALSCVADENGR